MDCAAHDLGHEYQGLIDGGWGIAASTNWAVG